jgi:hypothetical protein
MPPRITECREEGCTKQPLDQAIFCLEHLNKKRRCKATRAGTKGTQRCKKPALVGLEVCERHGGSFPQPQEQSARAVVLTQMQRFVRPFEGDLNPFVAFEMEMRRTLGRIAWYDEQLALLKDADDLIWGKTKEEVVTAAEFTGTNRTYEARLHLLEEAQRWERKHFIELERIWLAAGFEREKIDLFKAQETRLLKVVIRAIKELGLDPEDDDVRGTLSRVFLDGEHQPDYLALPAPRLDE